MPIGKFFGSAYRLDARAQGVVRVHVWGQTVTSVDPTEARKATVRRFGRSHRRAQADRPTLRSIRSKRAVSPALTRTIAPSAAVLEAASDPDRRAAWGEAGRRRVAERFSLEQMVAHYRHVCLQGDG